MANNDWMTDYQDRELRDLCLPGSHDAGTVADHVDLVGAGTSSNSITQVLTIAEQLQAGTRFLDLRLKTRGDRVVPHHTTAGQGAYGAIRVDDSIANAAQFCRDNPTEVVVFRISHTSASTGVVDIVKESGGDQLCKAAGNLSNKTLQQLKVGGGGLICIFEQDIFGRLINQPEGIHSYTKVKKGVTDQGITTCGCYSSTNALRKVITNAMKGQYAHQQHNKDHLWQVYWQKTYTNPFHGTGIREGTHKKAWISYEEDTDGVKTNGKVHGGVHAATDYAIHLMKGRAPLAGEDYAISKKKRIFRSTIVTMRSSLAERIALLPNIFSYDFVNPSMNEKIIALNQPDVQDMEEDAGVLELAEE